TRPLYLPASLYVSVVSEILFLSSCTPNCNPAGTTLQRSNASTLQPEELQAICRSQRHRLVCSIINDRPCRCSPGRRIQHWAMLQAESRCARRGPGDDDVLVRARDRQQRRSADICPREISRHLISSQKE